MGTTLGVPGTLLGACTLAPLPDRGNATGPGHKAGSVTETGIAVTGAVPEAATGTCVGVWVEKAGTLCIVVREVLTAETELCTLALA